MLALVRGLAERGHEVHLIWGREGAEEGRIAPGVPNTFVERLRRPVRPWNDAAAYAAIARQIRRFRPDVVHTHTAKAGALGRLAARRAGVPHLVHTFHGHVLSGYFSGPVNAGFRRIERALGPHTDAFVAVSPQVAEEVVALGVAESSQVHVVPLALDLEPFLRSKMTRTEARERLGVPADAAVIGAAGRLVAIKDVDTFLRAAALVDRSRSDLMVLVAGDGSERARLEALGADLLDHRVRFLGWVDDLELFYAALDVAVLTSRNEGTPVALIEAGAMRRPAVATRVGGVPAVVSDGRTGALVEVGDVDGLARAIADLLDDPDRARRWGEEAHARVVERWGSEATVDAIATLYRSLGSR